MHVVLDTNVLVSALISPSGAAHLVYKAWQAGEFRLISCEEQIAEMRRVTRRPAVRDFDQAGGSRAHHQSDPESGNHDRPRTADGSVA